MDGKADLKCSLLCVEYTMEKIYVYHEKQMVKQRIPVYIVLIQCTMKEIDLICEEEITIQCRFDYISITSFAT